MNRRELLDSLVKGGAGLAFSPLLAGAALPHADGVKLVLEQELSPVSLRDWKMTALEVVYAPGEIDRAHRHPGFVFGYVLAGELRFQVDGGKETKYGPGQMFYEAPGSVHRVSANASSTRPCRFLAMIFADKQSQLTEPA
jgi:quercetin dioxygenase-like cupin family protein